MTTTRHIRALISSPVAPTTMRACCVAEPIEGCRTNPLSPSTRATILCGQVARMIIARYRRQETLGRVFTGALTPGQAGQTACYLGTTATPRPREPAHLCINW